MKNSAAVCVADSKVATIARAAITTRLARPVFTIRVPAGFPSPAEAYLEGRLDLNRHLIRHPTATYYVRVTGDSMAPSIQEGDLLLVDRAIEAADNHIIIARLNDELCVKRLRIINGRVWLHSDNPAWQPITISTDTDFEVWGRVLYAITRL